MTLKLYYFPLSQPSRTVLAFLILNDIPFEQHVIDVFKDEQKSPEYLKINPLGLVPAINDNGFILSESEAIIRYLIDTHHISQKYYPEDPKQRALINRYMPFHHTQVRFNTVRYFRSSHPEVFPGLDYTLEEAKSGLLATCEAFEEHYLKENKYVAGSDDITFADLCCVNEFSQVYYTTDFDYSRFPKLKAYIERVLENPVMKRLNAPIKKFGEDDKKKKKAAETEQINVDKVEKPDKVSRFLKRTKSLKMFHRRK